jgi:phosphatidylserine/phosphatidylglycerophosphate/cardiolipin synthase-like enzyme
MDWYDAAFEKQLENIETRKRCGDAEAIAKSLASEANQPSNGEFLGTERQGLVRFGTHHQKPILIDFFHDEGRAAVGYIMGLNSLTEYWDTAAHLLDNPSREYERVVGGHATPGCRHVRPFRDYACRIDGGRALVAIHSNFIKAWERAAPSQSRGPDKAKPKGLGMPASCLRKARPGDSTVQIVRTQPEEGDKSIKDVYFQASDQAALAMGYIYIENQYFQYVEWAQRLMKKRKEVMESWNAVCASSGKTARDMPILHVFVVIPVPELEGMIPRTYETLATLGQQAGMSGQNDLIKAWNGARPSKAYAGVGQQIRLDPPEVVKDANRIRKPDERILETQFGLKICTAMLNTCDFANGKWRYREIYIHSKLLLIDDTFLTLGSANLNQRSMAVDSEINLAAIAPEKASELRQRIWGELGGSKATGKSGSRDDTVEAFGNWKAIMDENANKKAAGAPLSAFLLPLEDKRSSVIRLG